MKLITCSTVFILLVYGCTLKIAEARYSVDDDKILLEDNLLKAIPKDCEWNNNLASDFPAINPPMIWNTRVRKIVYPERKLGGSDNIIRVKSGIVLAMSCTGYLTNTINNVPNIFISPKLLNMRSVRVECENGVLYKVPDRQVIKMAEMGCEGKLQETVEINPPTKQGGGNSYMFGIGFFPIDPNDVDDMYTQIRFSFEQNYETTLWAEHTLHGGSYSAKDNTPTSPSWKNNIQDMFTPKIDTIYEATSQQKIFGGLIQSPGKMFAKGHLAPKVDFILGPEMSGTFQYLNALPQWAQINGGNWKIIEEDIRKLATNHRTDMRIITGGHKVLLFNGQEIYLGDTDKNAVGQHKVPIPLATWKIVIEESSNKGVAFITSNDPFSSITTPSPNTDICQILFKTWLRKLSTEKEKGHTYCFSIGDFKNEFPTISITLPANVNSNYGLLDK